MKRTPISTLPKDLPDALRPLLDGGAIYDSSCSEAARVYYIAKDSGYYLKTAPAGTLQTEAELTRYFHRAGLAAEVLDYTQGCRDWLLTARVPGEDCTHRSFLDEPKRLSALLGQLLRQLHGTDAAGCPVPDRTKTYLDTVFQNYHRGTYDKSAFPDNRGFASPEDAWQQVLAYAPYLKTDTLLHGDYCLPNILLNNWAFSGFIDLGCGGIGDRHIDLFWGIWSLQYNLKTDACTERFLDAYGRDRVEPELLQAIAAFEFFG